MSKKSIAAAILFWIIQLNPLIAQEDTRRLIQFSGVLVNSDSLQPIPFANVIIQNSYRGTTSDFFGYFSFVAQIQDTISFSHLGFKEASFIIPDSLEGNSYSLIQIMEPDSFLLNEAIVYPWPTKEQFKEAFLNLKIPDDDHERARANLDPALMQDRYEAMAMDGSMNFRNTMQQNSARLYYAGQFPPNNLLNPIAWAKFIRAWQNGDFKRKNRQ